VLKIKEDKKMLVNLNDVLQDAQKNKFGIKSVATQCSGEGYPRALFFAQKG
jgi:hypothetical protein